MLCPPKLYHVMTLRGMMSDATIQRPARDKVAGVR